MESEPKEDIGLTGAAEPPPPPAQPPPNGNAKKPDEAKEPDHPSSGSPGIIALGVYLILFCLLCLSLLATLMTAEEPPITVKNDKNQLCCGDECREVIDRKSPKPNANANVNMNAGSNNNAGNNPSNTDAKTNVATPAKAPVNATPNNTNTNGNSNATAAKVPINAAANNTNGNSNATPTPGAPLQQELPDITVPPYLCITKGFFPNFLTGFFSADTYVFLIVLFAGILGGIIRGIASFFTHVAKDFSYNWTWFYILLPFSGGALSVVIYFVIRGGFYGATFGKGLVLNIFSFAALATLAGLFSANAMIKLEQLATSLLGKAPSRRDRD